MAIFFCSDETLKLFGAQKKKNIYVFQLITGVFLIRRSVAQADRVSLPVAQADRVSLPVRSVAQADRVSLPVAQADRVSLPVSGSGRQGQPPSEWLRQTGSASQ